MNSIPGTGTTSSGTVTHQSTDAFHWALQQQYEMIGRFRSEHTWRKIYNAAKRKEAWALKRIEDEGIRERVKTL